MANREIQETLRLPPRWQDTTKIRGSRWTKDSEGARVPMISPPSGLYAVSSPLFWAAIGRHYITESHFLHQLWAYRQTIKEL